MKIESDLPACVWRCGGIAIGQWNCSL